MLSALCCAIYTLVYLFICIQNQNSKWSHILNLLWFQLRTNSILQHSMYNFQYREAVSFLSKPSQMSVFKLPNLSKWLSQQFQPHQSLLNSNFGIIFSNQFVPGLKNLHILGLIHTESTEIRSQHNETFFRSFQLGIYTTGIFLGFSFLKISFRTFCYSVGNSSIHTQEKAFWKFNF